MDTVHLHRWGIDVGRVSARHHEFVPAVLAVLCLRRSGAAWGFLVSVAFARKCAPCIAPPAQRMTGGHPVGLCTCVRHAKASKPNKKLPVDEGKRRRQNAPVSLWLSMALTLSPSPSLEVHPPRFSASPRTILRIWSHLGVRVFSSTFVALFCTMPRSM